MKKLLTATLLASVCSMASANDPLLNSADSLASSEAAGNVYMSSQQLNPMFGNQRMPETVIGRDFTSCPTSKLSMGVMPSHSSGDYSGRQRSISVGLSLDIPLNFEGAISRCRDQQKAQIIRTQTENITNIVSACMEVRRQGFLLDPKVIPWAKYCAGIKHEHPSASYIKARNEMLVDRVDHVEEHHFGKKVTHKH